MFLCCTGQDMFAMEACIDKMRNTYVNAELFVEHSLKKVMDRISVSCQVRDSVSFCRAMLCIVMRCLCVCPTRSRIVSKRINISSNFFHHRVAKPLYFFAYQSFWQYSDGDPGNGGVKYRCYEKNAIDFLPISRKRYKIGP